MGDGMRVVKIATVVMGIMILLGTVGLITAMLMRRPGSQVAPANLAVTLNEPPETRISGIAALSDRLAVLLQGGGADRVILVDPHTGAIAGRISVER
jgi:hypothetical protein